MCPCSTERNGLRRVSAGMRSQKISMKLNEKQPTYWRKRRGRSSNAYKGEKALYRAVHMWVERNYGKSSRCEKCHRSKLSGHQIQWSCRGDWKDRRRSNWRRLCAKCHCNYDIKRGGGLIKGWAKRRKVAAPAPKHHPINMTKLELARQNAIAAIKSGKRTKGVLHVIGVYNRLADRENVKRNPYKV